MSQEIEMMYHEVDKDVTRDWNDVTREWKDVTRDGKEITRDL